MPVRPGSRPASAPRTGRTANAPAAVVSSKSPATPPNISRPSSATQSRAANQEQNAKVPQASPKAKESESKPDRPGSARGPRKPNLKGLEDKPQRPGSARGPRKPNPKQNVASQDFRFGKPKEDIAVGEGVSGVRALKEKQAHRGDIDEVPRVRSKQVCKVPTLIVGSLEVVGEHGLGLEELNLLLQLKEVSHCRRIRLQLIPSCLVGKLLLMFPEGRFERARLPTVVRVLTKAAAKIEHAGASSNKMIFGHFAASLRDAAFANGLGILQLELLGSVHAFPNRVQNFKVSALSRIEELKDGQEETEALSVILNLACHIGRVLMPYSKSRNSHVEEMNFFEVFGNIGEDVLGQFEDQNKNQDCELSPGYFDGLGANHPELQEGVLIDIVADIAGKKSRMRPSIYFSKFYNDMMASVSFWKRRCIKGIMHGNVNLENIFHDNAGRAWVLAHEGAGSEQHAFCDLAKLLASTLFVHTRIASHKDEVFMRDLVKLLASMPSNLSSSLPTAPADCSTHVCFVWNFTRQVMPHFHDFSVAQGLTQSTDNFAIQLLWILLRYAFDMVPSARTRKYPETKRLALYAATAFAHRLWSETGKIEAQAWVCEHQQRWIPQPSDTNITIMHTGAQTEDIVSNLYLQSIGTAEAWSHEPFVGETYSVLEEKIELRLQDPGDSFWPDSAKGFDELSRLWDDFKCLVIVGGPGSGKKHMAQGMFTHMIQEQVDHEHIVKMPLRVPVAGLMPFLHQALDPLQMYINQTSDNDEAASLSWERLPVLKSHYPPRRNFQAVVFHNELIIFGGLGEDGHALRDSWLSADGGRTWEELPQPPWSARYNHAAVVFEDSIYVFGGMDGNERRLKDTWVSKDGRSWMEYPMPRWPARHSHQASVVSISTGRHKPERPLIVIVGGNIMGDKPAHDAWVSEDDGFTWRELETPPWPARYGHAAVSFQGKLHIIGGIGAANHKLQDSWTLMTPKWYFLSSDQSKMRASKTEDEVDVDRDINLWEAGPKPPWAGRSGHATCLYRNLLVIAGGLSDCGEQLSDAWATRDGNEWHLLPASQWHRASCRSGHQVVKFRGQQLVLGGCDTQKRWLREIYASRALCLVLDNLEKAGSAKADILDYLDAIMSDETHDEHQVLITTSHSALSDSVHEHFRRWGYKELHVEPFTPERAKEFCIRRLLDLAPDRVDSCEKDLLQRRDLISSPLTTRAVLLGILNNTADVYEVYQIACDNYLQFKVSSRSKPDLDLDACACELAFEMSRTSRREVFGEDLASLSRRSEAMRQFIRLCRDHEIALCEMSVTGNLRFINTVMQDWLAARSAWRCVLAGDGLPSWLLKDAVGNDFAMNSGRFFGALASRLCAPNPSFRTKRPCLLSISQDLRDGLGIVLRNIARVGDDEAASRLVNITQDPQILLVAPDGESGSTALHVAATCGHQAVVSRLLGLASDRVALTSAVTVAGYAALHCAAQCGHESVVRLMIQMAPPAQREALMIAAVKSNEQTQCPTALHLAAANGHHHVAQTLLQLIRDPGMLNRKADICGSTALHWAAAAGQHMVARVLLSHTMERHLLLTTTNIYEKKAPLHIAAEVGSESVAIVLLEMASDRQAVLTQPDRFGQTPLHIAAEKGHEAVIRTLLSLAPNKRTLMAQREPLTGQIALHMAADFGHGHAIAAMLEQFKDNPIELSRFLASKDQCGWYTALHLACEKGRANAVRTILEFTPDRAALLGMVERFSGQTAFHLACGAGYEDVVETMLDPAFLTVQERAAFLAHTDRSGGFAALHLAADRGHEEVIKVVLAPGVVPDAMELLQARVQYWCAFTALHVAIYMGHLAAAEMLLTFAPNPRHLLSLRDQKGRTPEELARDRGREKILAMLGRPEWQHKVHVSSDTGGRKHTVKQVPRTRRSLQAVVAATRAATQLPMKPSTASFQNGAGTGGGEPGLPSCWTADEF